MSSGERPIGAAKGKQSDTEVLCQPPPPPKAHRLFVFAFGGLRTAQPPDQWPSGPDRKVGEWVRLMGMPRLMPHASRALPPVVCMGGGGRHERISPLRKAAKIPPRRSHLAEVVRSKPGRRI